MMRVGSWLGCHQKPERSFFIKGYQFPVCARCTGVIIGQILAIAFLFFFKIKWWINLLLLIPMGIDWGLQFIKVLPSTNFRRLLTGLFAGFGLTYIYYYAGAWIISLIKNLF